MTHFRDVALRHWETRKGQGGILPTNISDSIPLAQKPERRSGRLVVSSKDKIFASAWAAVKTTNYPSCSTRFLHLTDRVKISEAGRRADPSLPTFRGFFPDRFGGRDGCRVGNPANHRRGSGLTYERFLHKCSQCNGENLPQKDLRHYFHSSSRDFVRADF